MGANNVCDEFNLLTGFMFFDSGQSPQQIANTWLDLVVRAGGAENLNDLAYNASWAAAASKYPGVSSIINDNTWRRSSYEFCFVNGLGYCSLFIINSYGNGVMDRAITPSIYLLNDGSCSSEFAIPASSFQKMIDQPPTPIIEDYYECVLTPVNALINAAGIASGNASLIVPMVMFALLPLMYLWLTLSGNVQPKPEYEKMEITAALECLSLQILRVRDNRRRGLKKEGYIQNLSEELTIAALNADGTAVDSDDSDDEYEIMAKKKAAPVHAHHQHHNNSEEVDDTVSPRPRPVSIKRQASKRSSNADGMRSKAHSAKELKFLRRNIQDSDDEDDSTSRTSITRRKSGHHHTTTNNNNNNNASLNPVHMNTITNANLSNHSPKKNLQSSVHEPEDLYDL